MTLAEQQALINKEIIVNLANLMIDCKILDVKSAFGHMQYLITPLAGSGEIWYRGTYILK